MVKVRSSRRVVGLKPSDYDHEIGLVNHDGVEDGQPSSISSTPADTRRGSTTSRLLLVQSEQGTSVQGQSSITNDGNDTIASRGEEGGTTSDQDVEQLPTDESLPHPAMQPSIEVQAATPDLFNDPSHRIMPQRPREMRETAMDIMYENERGGFMCGVALFSSKALGILDPPPWTNAYHKVSPTNINTAVVPDPSWEWIWPEWRVNYDEGVDEGGWEYSFAFSKKFSWHMPKWWNSFVRRRVWIRRRAKKKQMDTDSSGNLLNSDYFTIRPASYRSNRRSTGSLASSRVPSKTSMTHTSIKEVEEPPLEIEDMETLLSILRLSRIDREKREAVENYLQHAVDLSALQDEMHEIMSTFVFQASRRQLLAHLMLKYDESMNKGGEEGSKEAKRLKEREDALRAAVKHADEEVSKLAYWSDVKKIAERGEVRLQENKEKEWYNEHPGVDGSGPSMPKPGK